MIPCLATFYGTASLLKTWKMVGTHILANDRQAGWLSCDANDKLLASVRVQCAGGLAAPENYHATSCRIVFDQRDDLFAKLAEWDERCHFSAFVVAHSGQFLQGSVGRDPIGDDAVDPDVARLPQVREAACGADQSRLGGGVLS